MKRSLRRGTPSKPSDRPTPSILVVDDDPTFCHVLTMLLKSEGYIVECASNGADCLKIVAERPPDLVLLDILLPVKDGRVVCREIQQRANVPIIMMSALTADAEKVGRLNDGADDYISKPFNNDELLARIRAVLRRTQSRGPARQYRDDQLFVDFDAHQLIVHGKEVSLTPKEWRVLEYLHRHQGRTIDHQTLLRHVWGKDYTEAYHYLKGVVGSLRRKLGERGRHPQYIYNEYANGYRFEGRTRPG